MSGGRYIPRRKGNHEKYYQLTDSKEKTRTERRTKATPNDVPGTRWCQDDYRHVPTEEATLAMY